VIRFRYRRSWRLLKGRWDAYILSPRLQTEAERLFCAPVGISGRFYRDVPDGSRDRGIDLPACGRQAVDPSPRLRLGTFNGRRPTRESLIGNGGGGATVPFPLTAAPL